MPGIDAQPDDEARRLLRPRLGSEAVDPPCVEVEVGVRAAAGAEVAVLTTPHGIDGLDAARVLLGVMAGNCEGSGWWAFVDDAIERHVDGAAQVTVG